MIDKTVDLFHSGKIQAGMFISHRFGKNQLLDIFTKINEPGAQVIKAMITFAQWNAYFFAVCYLALVNPKRSCQKTASKAYYL